MAPCTHPLALVTVPLMLAAHTLSLVAATSGYPQTCAEYKLQTGDASDGTKDLFWLRNPNLRWQSYCHDMLGSPKEYLAVNPATNWGRVGAGGSYPGVQDLVTTFTRIRVDPSNNGTVNPVDFTFSTSSGQAGSIVQQRYGAGGSCSGNPGGLSADLGGTPFRFHPLTRYGTCASGGWANTVFLASDGKTASIAQIYGNCGGWTLAHDPNPLYCGAGWDTYPRLTWAATFSPTPSPTPTQTRTAVQRNCAAIVDAHGDVVHTEICAP